MVTIRTLLAFPARVGIPRVAVAATLLLLCPAGVGAATPADLPARLAATAPGFQLCMQKEESSSPVPSLVDFTVAVSSVGSVSVSMDTGPRGAAKACMEQLVLSAVTPLSAAPGTSLHFQLPPGFSVGQLIESEFAGAWSNATVLGLEARGRVRVAWDGWGSPTEYSRAATAVRPRPGVPVKVPVITEIPPVAAPVVLAVPAQPANTVPSKVAPASACQDLSDTYAIVAGVGFGFAPTAPRAQWTRAACNTRPSLVSVSSLCQYMSNTYGIDVSGASGTADIDVQASFKAMACMTRAPRAPVPAAPAKPPLAAPVPSPVTLSCQQLSDAYAMTPQARGFAPEPAKASWRQQICRTRPSATITAGLCQTMADRFGILNGQSFGSADADTAGSWVALGCTAEPRTR
jgi:hypothetical protein